MRQAVLRPAITGNPLNDLPDRAARPRWQPTRILTAFTVLTSLAVTLLFSACADDPSDAPQDTTAPASVDDLRVLEQTPRSVTLTWTSPEETGPEGRASRYDLRYRLDSIGADTWDLGTMVLAPVPQTPGSAEVLRIIPLQTGSTYGFALRSEDLAGNVSGLSNVLVVTLE